MSLTVHGALKKKNFFLTHMTFHLKTVRVQFGRAKFWSQFLNLLLFLYHGLQKNILNGLNAIKIILHFKLYVLTI